jgi:hypothetical protein
VGCTLGCLYCPFAEQNARRFGVQRPTVRDLAATLNDPAPPTVYLSASSDAFAPQAAHYTHALLARWLPAGTAVGIVTKAIIPNRTLDLLAEFRTQIEGISIGVTSLDERRNRIVEPGVPPAGARLTLIESISGRGLPAVLRMDPLFPGLDDGLNTLTALINEAERRGAWGVAAGYVFGWGRSLLRMRREPLLRDACHYLTERTRMAGGVGWGVSLARKIDLYTRLASIARAHGLHFQTCGCKDLRLHGFEHLFATRCTDNPFFTRLLPLYRSGGSSLTRNHSGAY